GLNRYQAVENVRSAKVFNRYVLFTVVCMPCAVTLYYLMNYLITSSNRFAFEAVRARLHTFIALNGTFGEVIVL
ncbi:hypothetical protein PENTCL1PPCAC_9247, partial [Pristionchus entomophagus]